MCLLLGFRRYIFDVLGDFDGSLIVFKERFILKEKVFGRVGYY